jgi:hypothetical protein
LYRLEIAKSDLNAVKILLDAEEYKGATTGHIMLLFMQ